MRTVTYAKALNEALSEELERDERTFVMGEDVGLHGGAYTVTRGLLERFGPGRVIDAPISELTILGAGVGAAITGSKPIVEIMYVDFLGLAMEMIVNQAAKIRFMTGGQATVPLVIRTQGGAGRGNAAQHSQSLEAWFTHIPGLRVVMPSTPYDAKGLLKRAIRGNNPVLFIEHKQLYFTKGEIPDEDYTVPFGKACVMRSGRDVTVVATSFSTRTAMGAAEALAAKGVDAEVIDPRTLVPLDEEAIFASVRKTGRLVVVHEACKTSGIGAEIAARVAERCFEHLKAPVARVAGDDVPIPYNMNLERTVIPSVEKVAAAVGGMLDRDRDRGRGR